ncbi:uncharacterized protein MKK02DRAFT_30729 [Dioszegia hungarica]|uniref:Uncharacterized protein n=1 Tax=Dioszegia hungarica TaxID=4972 RepID=A0AA38LPA5_9TREE|nr:uncharacterized protein MKK02DRAFT_30729 [Dioszegia hungarica]KAI9631722.1 hypothetical protein MKK02DRAFT_30729 [Dioszegia hungarica]
MTERVSASNACRLYSRHIPPSPMRVTVSSHSSAEQVFYKFRTNVGDKTRITFFLKVGDDARTFEGYGDALCVEVTEADKVKVSGATYACAADYKVNMIERNEAGEVTGVTIKGGWRFRPRQFPPLPRSYISSPKSVSDSPSAISMQFNFPARAAGGTLDIIVFAPARISTDFNFNRTSAIANVHFTRNDSALSVNGVRYTLKKGQNTIVMRGGKVTELDGPCLATQEAEETNTDTHHTQGDTRTPSDTRMESSVVRIEADISKDPVVSCTAEDTSKRDEDWELVLGSVERSKGSNPKTRFPDWRSFMRFRRK